MYITVDVYYRVHYTCALVTGDLSGYWPDLRGKATVLYGSTHGELDFREIPFATHPILNRCSLQLMFTTECTTHVPYIATGHLSGYWPDRSEGEGHSYSSINGKLEFGELPIATHSTK